MDVQGVPEIADPVAEVPATGDLHGGVEGHGEARHQQVRHSQRDQEVVVDLLKLVVLAKKKLQITIKKS